MNIGVSSIYLNSLKNLVVPDGLARNLRRADDFIKLAVVAAHEIFCLRNIEPDERGDGFGLIIGTGFGTMQTNFEVLDSVVFARQCSPTMFSHSVFNAAAGYTAAVLNLRGCALTVTDFAFPFFRALREGSLAIAAGRLSRCLVFQVETYSELLHFAREEEENDGIPWEPGVVCWLLEKDTVSGSCLARIQRLDIVDESCEPADTLFCRERVLIGEKGFIGRDPLAVPGYISEKILAGGVQSMLDCKIDAPWGNVVIHFF